MGEALALVRGVKKPPMIVQRLTDELIIQYWPKIAENLEKVPHIWKPYWTLEFIQQSALAGNTQLWGCGNRTEMYLIVWTQIATYPACRTLQVVLAIGSRVDEMAPFLEVELEYFARLCNCDMCEVIGRRGWWSRLKAIGFERRSEVFTKMIEKRSIN